MNWLVDALFPKKCVGCGKLGEFVCEKCEVKMWEEEQICPVCARNSRYGKRHKYCQKPFTLDGLICFWAYDGVVKKLISKAKYKFYYDYLTELIVESGQLTVRPEFYELNHFIGGNPVVVPVPLHKNRLKMRGFNQAEIIAKHLAKIWHLPFRDLLIRIKDTHQQVGRVRSDRLENIKGAFKLSTVHSQLSTPKAVLLVDDVWTTGSTLSECAKTLKQAGVKTVWGLVLAR